MSEPPTVLQPPRVVEQTALRDQIRVFQDRAHAGAVLAKLLAEYANTEGVVFGIPAGGVPVASVVARTLRLPLDVAVVSKITLPWNTEAGYGAVAYDGTVRLNEALIKQTGLTEEQIQEGIATTTAKVRKRIERFRGRRDFPDLSRGPTILVDDGLASGFTMRVAVEALKKHGAGEIVVAVPTGHARTVQALARTVNCIYCPNVRGGWSFAVADAYERWTDVGEDAVAELIGTALGSV